MSLIDFAQSTENTTMVDVFPKVVFNRDSVKNLLGWWFNPLPQVGSPVAALSSIPTAADGASKMLCKSQSYTTWNEINRSYIGSVSITAGHQVPAQIHRVDHIGDVPNDLERSAFTPSERKLYDMGKRRFLRGTGLLTLREFSARMDRQARRAAVALQAQNLQQRLDQGAAVPHLNLPADDNLGFYYSDTIPVRVFAVSNFTQSREFDEPIPYSTYYQHLAARLNDPAQTGVLSSVMRGPNVRDSTTTTALVKAMMLRQSTVLEIAAILRCGLMTLSVCEESYSTDSTYMRFVRKLINSTPGSMTIQRTPGWVREDWVATAVPIDIFVSICNNSFQGLCPDGFEYDSLDISWTAVPIKSNILGQSHLVPFAFSFMSSEAWNGTTNYYRTTQRLGPDNVQYNMIESYLPVANNIYVPGVKRVMFVLVDETAQTSQRNVPLIVGANTTNVPVWNGRGNAPQPTIIGEVWERFWATNRIEWILRDTTLAHNDICTSFGCQNAVGTAMSLLAECYGIWYNGICLDESNYSIAPDYTAPANGAWTYDGSPLDRTNMIKSHLFNLNEADKRSARRRAVAYNFSGITPTHLGPTGLVRARYTLVDNRYVITWETPNPEYAVPTYNISTMTSLYRVAAMAGLLLTHVESYRFPTGRALCQWVHMLSCALSFSSSAFLVCNDLTPRDWAGFDDRYARAYRDYTIQGLKNIFFWEMIAHHNMQDVFSGVNEWDVDIISEYYTLEPYNDINWLSFSPVPFNATFQWMNKMEGDLKSGDLSPGLVYFRYHGNDKFGTNILVTGGIHKIQSTATIDVYRHFPQIVAKEPDAPYVYIKHWIDCYSALSNQGAMAHIMPAWDMYSSQTLCPLVNDTGVPYIDPTKWIVVGSAYEYNDESVYGVRISPIAWPDPPVLDTLWSGAKNYILKPVTSALAGFLTGGSTGAAIAAGTQLAHQIITDTASKDQESKARTAIEEGEKSAKAVAGIPTIPTNPLTTKTGSLKETMDKTTESILNPTPGILPESTSTQKPMLISTSEAPGQRPTVNQAPQGSVTNE